MKRLPSGLLSLRDPTFTKGEPAVCRGPAPGTVTRSKNRIYKPRTFASSRRIMHHGRRACSKTDLVRAPGSRTLSQLLSLYPAGVVRCRQRERPFLPLFAHPRAQLRVFTRRLITFRAVVSTRCRQYRLLLVSCLAFHMKITSRSGPVLNVQCRHSLEKRIAGIEITRAFHPELNLGYGGSTARACVPELKEKDRCTGGGDGNSTMPNP